VQDILTNFEFRNQIPRLSKADALGQLIEKFLQAHEIVHTAALHQKADCPDETALARRQIFQRKRQLATLQGIAFDKTGTLTWGHLAVLEVQPLCVGISADRLLQLAAAAETQLHHPVARALVAHAQNIRGLELPMCEDVQFVIGMGVAAEVAGHRIHIGSARYLHSLGVATNKADTYLEDVERKGHIALPVALDEALVGAIACSDEPRPEARAVVAGLRQRGVREIVMLSGDRDGVSPRLILGWHLQHSDCCCMPKRPRCWSWHWQR
jgi:cation transport ATPase